MEDTASRTDTTQVFVNPDGTVTAEIHSGPVRAQNVDGDWAEIDTTLVEVDGGWALANAASSSTIPTGGSTFADMTVDGRDMSWQWPSALPIRLNEAPPGVLWMLKVRARLSFG